MRRFFLFRAPLAAYALLVVYISLTPNPPHGPDIQGIDKFYHFMVYAVMGLLLARAATEGGSAVADARRVVFMTAMAGFSFGVLMETGQMFVPERSPEALDALANGAGALFGAVVYGHLAFKKSTIGGT